MTKKPKTEAPIKKKIYLPEGIANIISFIIGFVAIIIILTVIIRLPVLGISMLVDNTSDYSTNALSIYMVIVSFIGGIAMLGVLKDDLFTTIKIPEVITKRKLVDKNKNPVVTTK